ncbi:MAG: cache domain-containing protein, partial [Deltaproteobacteria bacterium]|nr:cache domain-containing protein [Deltaproteobacteria bacterium]
MRIWRSDRKSLFGAAVAATTLLSLAAAGHLFIYKQFQANAFLHIQSQVEQHTQHVADEIETVVLEAMFDLQDFSGASIDSRNDMVDLYQQVEQWTKAHNSLFVKDVFIIDTAQQTAIGRESAALAPNQTTEEFLQDTRKKLSYGQNIQIIDIAGENYLHMFLPIQSAELFLGTLNLLFDLPALLNAYCLPDTYGTSFLALLDRQNHILYAPPANG